MLLSIVLGCGKSLVNVSETTFLVFSKLLGWACSALDLRVDQSDKHLNLRFVHTFIHSTTCCEVFCSVYWGAGE